MKRRRIYGRHRLSRDAERLAWLAQGLADSGSRLEDAWLESEISGLIEKLLKAGDEDALNQALDRLRETNSRAYDELADLIEAGCEVSQVRQSHSRLMIALPVLAWSRYAIPTRSVPKSLLDTLRAQLSAHILAPMPRVFRRLPVQPGPVAAGLRRYLGLCRWRCGTRRRRARHEGGQRVACRKARCSSPMCAI
jgi:hypothetical protein